MLNNEFHPVCAFLTKQKTTFSNILRQVPCYKEHYGRSYFLPVAIRLFNELLQGQAIVNLLVADKE